MDNTNSHRAAPSTPPAASAALPTPPTSHNEFRPPPNPVASSSRLNGDANDDQLPDASPTTTVSENMGPRRAAARLSGGSTSFDRNGDDSFSSQRKASRRSSIDLNDDRTKAAERPLDRSSYRSRAAHSPSHSPERSPTPSPILGPVFAADLPRSLRSLDDDEADDHDVLKLGHLSFPMLGVGVGPTKEEIELLVYGTTSGSKDAADPTTPGEDSGSVESILGSLANMGLDPPTESSASERERELAGMVKLLASRCNTLTESRDRAQSQLKSTRLTALSVISSMKQAHAHALAAHRNTTDRLEAELDGWKAQAKMLSALLNRAEAKGFDERRSSSTNSAPLVTFADRAKAAASSGTSPGHNRVASDSNQRLLSSPSFNDSAPTSSPGMTGLGISSSGLGEVDTDISPAASLLRERNKLLTDKKHLKARIRDAEAQVYKLESELKALRPYLVSSGVKGSDLPTDIHPGAQTPGEISQPGTAPTTPSRSGSRKDKNRKKRNVTMGDAETEHLMLAARRLRELRKEQAVAAAAAASASPVDSGSQENGKPALAPDGPQISHTSPIKRQASEGLNDQPPRTPPSNRTERAPKTPKSIASIPNTPRTTGGLRGRELEEDERRGSWGPAAGGRHRRMDSASSFTGIDELLQAAETLAPNHRAPSPTMRSRGLPPFAPLGNEPGYYPRDLPPPHRSMGYPPPPQLAVITSRGPEYESYPYNPAYPHQSSPLRMAHESPKRRRVSSAAFDFEPYSPFLGSTERAPRNRTQTEGADPFSHRPGYPRQDYTPSGPPSAGGSQVLSALDLLADQATASQNPSQGSDEGVSPIGSLSSDEEKSSKLKTKGGFGGNQNPEKRLPYVRWTAEEDTKLRAAIKEHGQRWELISRAVGTRSYHQCRQRYLLMRRKEAAAKKDGEVGNSASGASDQQSADSDYEAPKSGGREYEEGVTSTPLHKLSIGAPAPVGTVYGQFSPTQRHDAVLQSPSSQTPTHTRMLSHPGPMSPSMQHGDPGSPYSQTPNARRLHYPPQHPPQSPLAQHSRQLPPLQPPAGYDGRGPPSSPHSGGSGHGRRGEEPTTPSSSAARRMGAALYS